MRIIFIFETIFYNVYLYHTLYSREKKRRELQKISRNYQSFPQAELPLRIPSAISSDLLPLSILASLCASVNIYKHDLLVMCKVYRRKLIICNIFTIMRDLSLSLSSEIANSMIFATLPGILMKCVSLWRIGVLFCMHLNILRMSVKDQALRWLMVNPDSSLRCM